MAVKRAQTVVTQRNDASLAGERGLRSVPPEQPRTLPWRVRVVENLRERGQGLREMLVKDRFEVDVVEDAHGALSRLAEELAPEGPPPPDLLICNARMLGEPGFVLLERWCEAHPWVPVILVSAFTNPRLRARMERLPVRLVMDQAFALEDVHSAALALAESEAAS